MLKQNNTNNKTHLNSSATGSLLLLCASFGIALQFCLFCFCTGFDQKPPKSFYFHPPYLLSLLLWLEDPLEAVVPPPLPPLLHCPHCTALHWLHPCTTPCNPSTPPTSSISETGRQTNMSQGSLLLSHTHITQSRTSWPPQLPAGMCVCVLVWEMCTR